MSCTINIIQAKLTHIFYFYYTIACYCNLIVSLFVAIFKLFVNQDNSRKKSKGDFCPCFFTTYVINSALLEKDMLTTQRILLAAHFYIRTDIVVSNNRWLWRFCLMKAVDRQKKGNLLCSSTKCHGNLQPTDIGTDMA